MKKLLTLFGLTVAAGALVLGTAANQSAKESKATDYESYIPMQASFFTNWSDAAGGWGDQNSTFWGENYHFQALDTFYRGELAEGWTGTLTSRTWKQKTQYIYFQLGGAKNYDITGDAAHINIKYGGHQYSFYNDTFVENPMLLRYYKIPDAIYQELMAAGDDFDMSIEIVDYQTADYGFVNFGYLHVNQSEEQVGDAMRFYLNNMNHDDREWEVNKRKQILENYYLNGGLREIFLKAASNIDDDFEDNTAFLNHWYFDYAYANGANWGMRFDQAIGTDYARPDDATMMPFNKTGSGFFRGWHENDTIGGFVGGDQSIYRFFSRPFVLGGTGLVSIKMAGTASLHVIDAETRQELAWGNLLTFSTEGDQVNLATSDFNTVTMVRHIINLEAYIGRKIQLAIADVSDGGWSALYVDELVTNYETYPSFKIDYFSQNNTSGEFHVYKTDKYINSTVFNDSTNPSGLRYVLESAINNEGENRIVDHVDNTPMREAYEFLQSYYGTLRTPSNEFDYTKLDESVLIDKVNSFNALSAAAKELVYDSKDIQVPSYTEEWYRNAYDVTKSVRDQFYPLVDTYSTYTVSFDANGGTGEMAPVTDQKLGYVMPSCAFTAPENYQFAGWKVNGEGETLQAGVDSIDLHADVTLVAQWELIPATYYTVSFAANGGSGEMESVVKVEGAKYELPGNGFTEPEGYEFDGWLVNDTKYQPGDEITVNSDVVVTASWKELPKALTGTVAIQSHATYGDTLVASVTDSNNTGVLSYQWTRDGVNIEGATSNEYQTVIDDIHTFIAVNVTSSVETGSLTSNSVYITKLANMNEPTGLTTTACTNENNNDGTIIGVSTDMEYKNEDESYFHPCEGTVITGLVPGTYHVRFVESATHDASAVATVIVGEYVAPTQYAITVSGGHANVTSAPAGTVVTITADAAPAGYEFERWISDDVTFADENASTTTFVMPEQDVVIRVGYKDLPPVMCVVSFNANGGSGSMESVEVVKGQQYTLPACGFTAPEGREFAGWLIGSVRYQPGEKLTIAGDTVFKADWKVKEESKPVEPEKEDGSGSEQGELSPVEQVWNTVKEFLINVYKKVVEFFQKLMANANQ